MITSIVVKNFKTLRKLSLELNSNLNIIVGDNESGKSTILEAVNLALTKRLNGRMLEYEVSPYLINRETVLKYIQELRDGKNPELPVVIIELYMSDDCGLDIMRGTNNSKRENHIGMRLELSFSEDYKQEYMELIKDPSSVKTIPTEFYTVKWTSFSGSSVSPRGVKIGASYIDTTTIRLQSGTDYYMRDIIERNLDEKERVALSLAYRNLKEAFSDQASIKSINQKLMKNKGGLIDKDFAISLDISQRFGWESSLIPHLDEVPFLQIGKGGQNILKMLLALEQRADDKNIILIEEPENHLSYSSMNKLISKIRDKCSGKQLIIATHSAHVVNKLGLDSLILVSVGREKPTKFSDLPTDTRDYFMKLSGYDTLRLVLAKKAILVEGPSDELIVQKAFLQKYSVLPIEKGMDVINIRGLSFKRFLDIAKKLSNEVAVVTDNDGDYEKNIKGKYEDYGMCSNIRICSSTDDRLPTLEPQIVEVNTLDALNRVLGDKWDNKEELVEYMMKPKNKTECALKIFNSEENINYPDYINDAIAQ